MLPNWKCCVTALAAAFNKETSSMEENMLAATKLLIIKL